MERLHLSHVVQTVGALEAVIVRSFGPNGGQVLFTRDTGQAMLSRSGTRILSALRLDHPLARMVIGCASAHSAQTGDGSKTFILLLASLVRMIHMTASKDPHVSQSYNSRDEAGSATARRLADELLSFALQELDHLICVRVVPYGRCLSWPDFTTTAQSPVLKVLSPLFHTRLGHSNCDFMSGLFFEMLTNWKSNDDMPISSLHFLNDMFPALYTPVVGFPVSYSRLIEGQVIHRDFASPVTQTAQDSVKAVVLTGSLQPELLNAGEVLQLRCDALGDKGNILHFSSFAESSLQCAIENLQSLGVSVLLSSVKQSAAVLSLTAQAQICMVECVSQEELSLFSHLSGATPVSVYWRIQPSHVVSLAFCRPILLGAHRYVHVGFLESDNVKPCSLVVCGSGEGQTEQYASALHDVVRTLLTTWEPIIAPTSGGSQNKSSKSLITRTPCGTTSAPTCQNSTQGCVLPAGGTFEFLLNHALLQQSFSVSHNTNAVVSRILASSLLCVPRQIYSHSSRHFVQTQSEVLKYIEEHSTGPIHCQCKSPLEGDGFKSQCYLKSDLLDTGLESVSCKHQLILAVLQCVSSLFRVDTVLHTHTRLKTQSFRQTNISWEDSEDEAEN